MPQRILQRGACAALLSGLLLVLRGRSELASGAAPLNAISHWLWPRSAFAVNGVSLRHTTTGALIHFGASCFWSALYEWRRSARRPCEGVPPLRDALALTALAAWVDLAVAPPALRPGFERRLSATSLCLVYAAFGAGLALGERKPRPPAATRQGLPHEH